MKIEIYNLFWMMNDFLNTLLMFFIYFVTLPKDSKKINWIISFITSAVFVFIDSFLTGYSSLISLIVIPICLILIRSQYKMITKLLVCIFSLFLSTFTQGMGSALILKALPSLTNPQTNVDSIFLFVTLSILNYLIAFLFLWIFKLIIIKFFNTSLFEDSTIEKIILLSLAIFLLSYFILYATIDNLNVQKTYLHLTLAIMFMVIIFITIGTSMLIYSRIRYIKTEMKMEQIKERNSYIDELEKNNDELHKFKHDYKNLLLSLAASVKDSDDATLKLSIEKLLNYKRMNLDSDSDTTNLYKISDKLVKGILVSKLIYARNNNINAHFEIDDNITIPTAYSVDITRILGILLDNAIDACQETDHPKLSFALVSFDGYMEFIVMNNINPTSNITINNVYKEGFTTKKKHTGQGLASVQEIVNSSKGLFIQTEIKNDHYSTILTVLEDK